MDAFHVVAEERKMTWKILPDKQKIGNWETQKRLQNLQVENGRLGFAVIFLFKMAV